MSSVARSGVRHGSVSSVLVSREIEETDTYGYNECHFLKLLLLCQFRVLCMCQCFIRIEPKKLFWRGLVWWLGWVERWVEWMNLSSLQGRGWFGWCMWNEGCRWTLRWNSMMLCNAWLGCDGRGFNWGFECFEGSVFWRIQLPFNLK